MLVRPFDIAQMSKEPNCVCVGGCSARAPAVSGSTVEMREPHVSGDRIENCFVNIPFAQVGAVDEDG